jgi:ABC-type amino acid transport substrate-binding protein
MRTLSEKLRWITAVAILTALSAFSAGSGADLPEVRKQGVLRHLGIPYANFVTGSGTGLDVELMQGFAKHLGVRYEYVKTDWGTVIEDLTGKKVAPKGSDVETLGTAPVKGDVVANGFTILPWREKVVDFSSPTFPSQIWLIARATSKIRPIKPSGNLEDDIINTRKLMNGKRVLSLRNTCLDPVANKLAETGADVICFNGKLNELAPAVLSGKAEMTILDVPDALVALKKWRGKIKVIGPVSGKQLMGVAFPKEAPQLREAFDHYFEQCVKNGSYRQLVNRYYPAVFDYFPEFLHSK